MRIPLAEAEGQLAELARRADAGDEIVLTRDGARDVRLVLDAARDAVALTTAARLSSEERLARIRALQASVAQRATPGPDAARSQDFLYDEFGVPE